MGVHRRQRQRQPWRPMAGGGVRTWLRARAAGRRARLPARRPCTRGHIRWPQRPPSAPGRGRGLLRTASPRWWGVRGDEPPGGGGGARRRRRRWRGERTASAFPAAAALLHRAGGADQRSEGVQGAATERFGKAGRVEELLRGGHSVRVLLKALGRQCARRLDERSAWPGGGSLAVSGATGRPPALRTTLEGPTARAGLQVSCVQGRPGSSQQDAASWQECWAKPAPLPPCSLQAIAWKPAAVAPGAGGGPRASGGARVLPTPRQRSPASSWQPRRQHRAAHRPPRRRWGPAVAISCMC